MSEVIRTTIFIGKLVSENFAFDIFFDSDFIFIEIVLISQKAIKPLRKTNWISKIAIEIVLMLKDGLNVSDNLDIVWRLPYKFSQKLKRRPKSGIKAFYYFTKYWMLGVYLFAYVQSSYRNNISTLKLILQKQCFECFNRFLN